MAFFSSVMVSCVRLVRLICAPSFVWWLVVSVGRCVTCVFCCDAVTCWVCWLSVVPLYFTLLLILNGKNINCLHCDRSWRTYFLPSAIVVIFSESWVDVMLPTDVISVTSVVLGISRRTIGTDSNDRLSNGSSSVLVPSIHARASGPIFRTKAWQRKFNFQMNPFKPIWGKGTGRNVPVTQFLSPSTPCGSDNYSTWPHAFAIPIHRPTNRDDFSTLAATLPVYVCRPYPVDSVSIPPAK